MGWWTKHFSAFTLLKAMQGDIALAGGKVFYGALNAQANPTVFMFARIGQDAIPALAAGLTSQDLNLKGLARDILREIDTDEYGISLFRGGLQSRDAYVRFWAARGLSRVDYLLETLEVAKIGIYDNLLLELNRVANKENSSRAQKAMRETIQGITTIVMQRPVV